MMVINEASDKIPIAFGDGAIEVRAVTHYVVGLSQFLPRSAVLVEIVFNWEEAAFSMFYAAMGVNAAHYRGAPPPIMMHGAAGGLDALEVENELGMMGAPQFVVDRVIDLLPPAPRPHP